ncbi:MAG: hydantoinase/oxoprolinase family protein [Candidatus Azotimanducaceae bacterium]|uniref:Hydantoinase/oxoprolinase family protein n=1 Tax=OM182 bacterium TaxID=2510334 RepID=A0A520S5F4_9GAMM|nr:hydantoinase [Gammaproteobacteria bacterium]OUV68689.1 MAG: hypothetical protein CBC93_01315 [Gammaproteobacteria bacterium TMED133]RZO77691.1 MAG: hydantoinase/oxoprolinase family protein [OM182 bacterium]
MTIELLGIDTGGTFTDFVYLGQGQFKVHKVLSTPENPVLAIEQGIDDLDLMTKIKAGTLRVIHGTTVATNALLEEKGVSTAYITNSGMRDLLKIGRQTRLELYNLKPSKLEPPIEDSLIFEVGGRHNSVGQEIEPLNQEELRNLKKAVQSKKPKSIAINLLFSYMNNDHEKRIEALFTDDYFISRSSYLLPEQNEYERGMTTWINAWIGPLINKYMLSLTRFFSPNPISILQSNATTIASHQASKRAANLILSGPAGGLTAVRLFQSSDVISFDMGGTSTDVSLLRDDIRLKNIRVVGKFPLAVPMADIHTIGAGGGSIAFIDKGGLLQVGPESAGAKPGPACYGMGGDRPTVTDANLILGRLVPDTFLGGTIPLYLDKAVNAVSPLAERLSLNIHQTALGIVSIANESMTQALRHISIQRGFDPSRFTLVCFGGAGGLHICELAKAMNITRAMIPIMSGVLSALGMIATNPGRELTRTYCKLLDKIKREEIHLLCEDLLTSGVNELKAEGVINITHQFSMDLRYLGQTSTIRVPFTNISTSKKQFNEIHQQQYGHKHELPIELLNLRLHLEAQPLPLRIPKLKIAGNTKPVRFVDLPEVGKSVPIFSRENLAPKQKLAGPALISDSHSTTLVMRGWELEVDNVGNLWLNLAK